MNKKGVSVYTLYWQCMGCGNKSQYKGFKQKECKDKALADGWTKDQTPMTCFNCKQMKG